MIPGVCRYELDQENRLRSVDEGWSAFARANAAPELAGDALLGRSIWSSIAGEGTRRVYGLLFQKARHEDKPVRVPFRCDSPTERRYMELSIDPLPGDALALAGRLLRSERRPPEALLDSAVFRSSARVPICGWCKRLNTRPGEWLEVEEAAAALKLLEVEALPQLDHVVCDECASPWRETTDREGTQR